MTLSSPTGAPVVKLGGSLFAHPALGALLDVAVRRGALLVAGGGVFAEGVRDAQRALGFDDRAAHAMAILAMQQGALLIASRRPDLALCATRREIAHAAEAGRAALWAPAAMASRADVPASWDATSDSLALWLALETRAAHVALVKSCPAPAEGDAADWAVAGVVDAHLPILAARFPGRLTVVGDASAEALDAALAAPERVAA